MPCLRRHSTTPLSENPSLLCSNLRVAILARNHSRETLHATGQPEAVRSPLCGALTLVHSAWAQTPPIAPPPISTAYVATSMKTFDVPGMAVAIVKDGKIVVAKGYGVRKLGDPTPVDEFTMFGIGSNTKAFTTAALATLVDEGKLSWDDPVYQRLPGFVMYDPYVSHEMTIRDLLTHRSGMGLGEGDLLFWPHSTYTREEVIYKLRFMKPASSFRSHYAYDNLLYMTAGQIIPAVTGTSWDDYVRQRIFAPLGMNHTNVSNAGIKPGRQRGVSALVSGRQAPGHPLRSARQRCPGWRHQLLRRRHGEVGAVATQPRKVYRS